MRKLLVVSLALVAVIAAACSDATAPRDQSIVIVRCDTTRKADTVGCVTFPIERH